MSAEQLRLVKAGGSSLTVSWQVSAVGLEAEHRKTAWLRAGPWVAYPASRLEVTSSKEDGVETSTVVLSELEQQTVYDVRLIAQLADGTRHTSPMGTFSTLTGAPRLTEKPEVKCARHDRLLLRWKGPASQADEVVGYHVRYWDTQPRWPVSKDIEAKLPSRLLRRSEQMTQFLSGSVVMKSAPTVAGTANASGGTSESGVSDTEDGGEADEVQFWLIDLMPDRLYYVKVAAVTKGGVGQWSPRSLPLYTWRVAPSLRPPQQLFHTHASIAIGLALEPLSVETNVQDEEVERFEVVLHPVRGDASAAMHLKVSREDAAELAAQLSQRLEADPVPGKCVPSFVVAASGLSPAASYTCTARAITHAGDGQYSQATSMETLAVPPEINDLRVDRVLHDRASLSWQVLERCAPPGLVQAYLGETAQAELEARHLRGFRVRVAERGPNSWREVIGIRAVSMDAGTRISHDLQGFEPSSHYRVQVAAVARRDGEGAWSDVADIHTEALAPVLPHAPLVEVVTRSRALLRWPKLHDLTDAPVLAYKVSVSQGRGRKPEGHELPLLPDARAAAEQQDGGRGTVWSEGSETRLALEYLEPDKVYIVNVAAMTSRGVGASSTCSLRTLPCAPAMGGQAGPRLVRAYYNRLLLVNDGPIADWRQEEGSDIVGYRARYYETGAGGRFAAQRGKVHEVDVDFKEIAGGEAVHFWLTDLSHEREYVVQIAARTVFGHGLWSAESQRLSTWRLAPALQAPQVLFRTHSALVVGWCLEPACRGPDDTGHDEEITDFVVRTSSAASSTSALVGDGGLRVSRGRAEELARALREPNVLIRHHFAAADGRPEEDMALELTGSTSAGAAYLRDVEVTFGDTMLLEDFRACIHLDYVAVIPNLEPDRNYTCTVSAVTVAGVGHPSPSSAQKSTLAIAPYIDNIQVDEVQQDRIQVSWSEPCTQAPISQAACLELGLDKSVAELELKGFDIRCAPSTTWTRPTWRDHEHIPVGDLRRDKEGRPFVNVAGLQAERPYFVEIRACSARGAGVWCRVDDQPICTAIDAHAPPVPELVKNAPDALTFSFAGIEDSRIVAYEVRHIVWIDGAAQHSKPIRFDAAASGVRVTSERRWVVTVDNLRSETPHSLQLRGVTANGGITKWSAWSEAMRTLRNGDAGGDAAGGAGAVSSLETTRAIVSRSSTRNSITSPRSMEATASRGPLDAGMEPLNDLARKLEKLLEFAVDQATAGVKLPSVTVPSVSEKAQALLQEHRGRHAAAIAAAATVEDDVLWRTKLPDFLVHQAPVAGCSTLLLRELWRTLRRCALIAHLYGHDTRAAGTQALLFTCLVPQSATDATFAGGASHADAAGERRVAQLVARTLAKETITFSACQRSEGRQLGNLEAAGIVLKDYASVGAQAAGGSVDWHLGEVKTTGGPAGLSEAAADDTGPPNPTRVAQAIFRPPKVEEHPATILGLFALWLLPLFVSACRFVGRQLLPLLVQKVRMDLSLAGIVLLLVIAQAIGVALVMWVQENLDTIACFPASFVFVLYSAAPGLSIWLSTRSTLKSLNVAPCFVAVSLYSLVTGYLRWADDLLDDSTLERRAVPRMVWGRRRQRCAVRAHKVLWVLLILDFVVEELLGRWFGLHSRRLLGPAEPTMVPEEYQPPAFVLFLVAAFAHERVLGLTKRHTVLVRMLGAQREQLAELRLFLMGAPVVAVDPARTFKFLRDVSPSARWCCVVLFLRRWGAAGGLAIPLSLYVLRDHNYLGRLSTETLVPVAVALGAVLGNVATSAFAVLYQEYRDHIEAKHRVLHLFPHMNAKARARATDAFHQAFKHSDDVVEVVATRTGWLWLARRRFGNLPGTVGELFQYQAEASVRLTRS